MEDIEKKLKSHPFITPWFLQNYNIQTLFASLVPYFQTTMPKIEQKFIRHPDGSTLVADCWFQKNKEKHKTIIIVSGFEGFRHKKRSRFAKQAAYKAYHSGFNVIHLLQRGEGDTVKLTKSLMTYLENDIEVALKQFIDEGIKKFYIIGFSSGGYASLFEIPQIKDKIKNNLLGLVIISAPFNLFGTWAHVEKREFYNWIFLRTYKHFIKRRLAIDPPGTWDEAPLKTIKTKRQLFEIYKHKWGYPEKFSSLEDYHNKTDVIPLLQKISTPTLIINAYDDPIAPNEPLINLKNPNIITLLPKHGGHGGFFTTKKLYGDLDGHWAQNRAMEFIQLLDRHSGESR